MMTVPEFKEAMLYEYVRTRLRRHLIDQGILDPPVDALDQLVSEAIERFEEIFEEMAEEAATP